MKKVAVFVEGQTETIVVREFLCKHFNYNVDIICRRLHRDGNIEKEEFDYPVPNADFHFQIINVGNDVAVLSQILKREKFLYSAEYIKIIGLRDLYSKEYKEISKVINQELIDKFIDGAKKTIIEKSLDSTKIFLNFAIMEVEAWFFVIYDIFQKMHADLTLENINSALKVNLQEIDPEKKFYHPAKELNAVYGLIYQEYDKKKGTINSLVSHYNAAEIKQLFDSPKCQSFNQFWSSLI